MKRIAKFLVALLFSVIISGVVSAATGVNPIAVMGALQVGATAMPSGVMPMALNVEVWKSSIIEGLFADNSFLSKAHDSSEFVDNKTVHIPNAGAPSGTKKNRTELPATITTRGDNDLTFSVDEFTTDPIRISDIEKTELSYNKRESVISQDRAALHEAIAESILFNWMPASAQCITTTGDAVVAHTPNATGNRKAFTKDDVMTAMNQFNADNVPQEGRYLLIDAVMYAQLLNSLTTQEAQAFHAAVDVKNGVLGKLYGFNIMMRSRVGRYNSTGAAKEWSTGGTATDNAAALAWHKESLTRALGKVKMFGDEGNPTYYSDIYSFLARAGGSKLRYDNKGILAIRQAAVA